MVLRARLNVSMPERWIEAVEVGLNGFVGGPRGGRVRPCEPKVWCRWTCSGSLWVERKPKEVTEAGRGW
jgi:hypothetical protein